VSPAPRPSKILVLDDEHAMRELLALHLRNAGYEVTAAADAVEAAHLTVRNPPDTRHIPVVFVTSDDDVDRTRSCSAPRTLFTQT
jgi:DNA-binding NtrC family response regulator